MELETKASNTQIDISNTDTDIERARFGQKISKSVIEIMNQQSDSYEKLINEVIDTYENLLDVTKYLHAKDDFEESVIISPVDKKSILLNSILFVIMFLMIIL